MQIFSNSKGESTRKRLMQEWTTSLSDSLKILIISLEEMRSKYRFGPRQFLHMLIYLILTVFMVFVLFSCSRPIISRK